VFDSNLPERRDGIRRIPMFVIYLIPPEAHGRPGYGIGATAQQQPVADQWFATTIRRAITSGLTKYAAEINKH
jgi:hypothetical protein